jgi:acetyltransferase EpsM
MKKIGIIGSGGHAKVIMDIINEINFIKFNTYHIIGIFDDNKTGYFNNVKILNTINNINRYDVDSFVIAIGNDKIRKKIYEKYKNIIWETLIHPTSYISKNVFIGKGTIICAGSLIQTEVNIGNQCIINTGSSIDHETIIGDFTSICPKATICGQVKIGTCTMIGANSTIIQNIIIGDNCIIGAGTVIICCVNNNSKIVGNPGKIIDK